MNAKSVTSVIPALENIVKASVRMADSSQIISISGRTGERSLDGERF